MKEGRIADSKAINAFIYRCFEYLCDDDERKFLKKFREQPVDSDQIMHTFRELVLGSYLSSYGFTARYDNAVDSQTPDWCILNDKLMVIGIVELINFHIDKATEKDIEQQLESNSIASYWRDKNKDNIHRLHRCIEDKATTYRTLVKKLNVPYVVAIFGHFETAVDFEEVYLCLSDKEVGLFDMYPEMSGILYFNESFGRYSFNYASNPNALQLIDLPRGVFP